MNARDAFRAAYAGALRAYLDEPREAALGVAYQLGRDAVGARLGVLDLAAMHNDALLEAVRGRAGLEVVRVVAAAGEFFLESLSAFEMVQRGFHEVREAARAEKRQTTMLRRLSGFLADASLALDGPRGLEVVLQLVAEHARELAGAGWCLATLTLEGGDEPLAALAAAGAPGPEVEPQIVRKLAPPPSAAVARAGATELAGEPVACALARLLGLHRPLRGRLAVPLRTLDGAELGWIQLFDKEGGFTEADEATAVHLAQVTAAAVERVRMHALR